VFDIHSVRCIDDFFRYDGETFVKEVDVNYIMWEQHGRADYKYSATMKEVCHWWRVAVDYLSVSF